jgi:hypothetical protein
MFENGKLFNSDSISERLSLRFSMLTLTIFSDIIILNNLKVFNTFFYKFIKTDPLFP